MLPQNVSKMSNIEAFESVWSKFLFFSWSVFVVDIFGGNLRECHYTSEKVTKIINSSIFESVNLLTF